MKFVSVSQPQYKYVKSLFLHFAELTERIIKNKKNYIGIFQQEFFQKFRRRRTLDHQGSLWLDDQQSEHWDWGAQ